VDGGELDRNVIRRYLRQKHGRISYCYERELLASPKLAGTAQVSFLITGGGIVTLARATGLGNAAVEAFLTSIVFPRPEGGPVRVVFPLVLQPPTVESP
jgi:hypothetical protein